MNQNVLLFGAVLLAAEAGASCGDPVHDAEVAALGPEVDGIPRGPTHRAGQPCLTCHGGLGPAGAVFVTAGTVYVDQYQAGVTPTPLVGGTVTLIDANGTSPATVPTTNEVGNFFVRAEDWGAVFPLGGPNSSQNIAVAPSGAPTHAALMTTEISRGGVYASCAYCHFDPPGPSSPGHVFQD